MGTDRLSRADSHGLVRPLEGTPVLLYHGLTEASNPGVPRRELKYWVSASLFREHIGVLCQEPNRVMSLSGFWNLPRSTDAGNGVVVTFDDGGASDYEQAFGVLVSKGIQATFFINTATIGAAGYLTWSQIEEMRRFGMCFQSHGHDHVSLVCLSKQELKRQLVQSKRLIEDHLGTAVRFLATPYGDVNESILALATETGYCSVCTSRTWPAQSGALAVNRTVIYGTTTPDQFRRLVDRDRALYSARILRQALIYIPKEVFALARRTRSQVP